MNEMHEEPPPERTEAPPPPAPPARAKKKRLPKSRPITDEDRVEIERLHSEVKLGTREIAKHVGLSRRQVRRVVEATRSAPTSSEKSPGLRARTALLAPYRVAIEERAAKGLTTTRILR